MHAIVASFVQNILLQLSLQMSQSFCLLTMTITTAMKVPCQTLCGGTATSWTTIRSISCWCAWCVGSYSTPTASRELGSTLTRPIRTLWPWTRGRNSEYWKPGTSRCPSGSDSSAASSSSIVGLWQVQYDVARHKRWLPGAPSLISLKEILTSIVAEEEKTLCSFSSGNRLHSAAPRISKWYHRW